MPKHQITIERFATQFQLAEKQPTEAGRFRGLASVFGSPVDTVGMLGVRTRFRPGAFKKTLADRAMRVKILSAHDQGAVPIGLPVSLQETSEGLEIVGSLNQTALGQDWAAMIQHAKELGQLDAVEMSIGFDSIQDAMVEDEDDGEMFREIIEARLWEVSLVSAGADRHTRVLEAASLEAMRGLSLEAFEAERQRQLAEIERFEKQYGVEVEDEWRRIQRTYFPAPWIR